MIHIERYIITHECFRLHCFGMYMLLLLVALMTYTDRALLLGSSHENHIIFGSQIIGGNQEH